ncbi:sulfotransferase family protein [Mycobacterium sp. CVI_P3]|uniref:Sulfotransferase family protein n=1 Tax=Mycobacterium pinniadriaticum TaxID=2994102 RepID=A0ABT3SMC6_9MYCO|nr:sulfotransferase family protein [Mycobacterium pinniadriaticum]MCX2933896.1 sulfotransferase family protein [Mycobacterium pinniadriaticum]MCX2940318.1 sulfotransferase family protein [Mycobacterium pinniadriaticum]
MTSRPSAENPAGRAQRAEQSGTRTRPVALFVLGNGRSGTSALARVLSLCGGTLPPGLLGATSENPRGFFEARAVIHLNQAILHDHDSSGYDMALDRYQDGEFDARRNAIWVAKLRDYLRSLPPAPVLVIKEPKTTTVSDIWFEAARQAGFDVTAVVAVRHPEEVIASLAKRTNQQNYVEASPELICAWWLKYSLLAERNTRGVPRVFVEYTNLLEDWRRELERVSTALAIDLDAPNEEDVDEFLTPDLRHHQTCGPVTEPFGSDWIGTVYETLAAAAGDEPWDEAALDRVFEEYAVSERGFRQAFKDSRRYRNLDRLLPPFVVKLGLETLALAHRRRGTWA